MDEKVFVVTLKLTKLHLLVLSYGIAIAFGALLHWGFVNAKW